MSFNSEMTKKAAFDQDNVVFKGYKSGLTLVIPESGPFEKYLEELKTNLEQSQEFFKGAKVFIKIGKRTLQDDEWAALNLIMKQSGLNFQGFQEAVKPGPIHEKAEEIDPFISTITVRKTVRSGQRVVFDGNLVIIGDVNPGAELVAAGDIIVLGRLRGTAHAGAKGDTSAQIIAFQLQPVQIRIAGVITRAPEQEPESDFHGPEVARIKEGLIIVERYKY